MAVTPRQLVAGAAVVAVTGTGAGLAASNCNGPSAITVPTSVAADCSVDVTAQLNSLISTAPSGATVQLGTNACYLVNDKLSVTGTSNVTIAGNGATFKQTTYAGNNTQQPVLTLGGTTGLTVNNLNVTGPGASGGASAEGDIGLLLWQDTNLTLDDVNISGVQGDGIDLYAKGGNQPGVSNNVTYENGSIAAGYHAIVPEYVKGFTLDKSTVTSGNIDAEVDFNCQSNPSDCGTLADPNVGIVGLTIENSVFPSGLQLLDGASCMPVGNWKVLNNNLGTGGLNVQMNTTYSLTLDELNVCGQYDGLQIIHNWGTATSLKPCCGAGSPYILVQGWKNVVISQNVQILPFNAMGAWIELWACTNVTLDSNMIANAPGLWDSSPAPGWPAVVNVTATGNTPAQ